MAEEELELEHQHGKARVRVARLWRSKADGQPHDLVEWNVSVSLTSKVLPAFTEGDNSNIVATDTIKNTVQISISLFLSLSLWLFVCSLKFAHSFLQFVLLCVL